MRHRFPAGTLANVLDPPQPAPPVGRVLAILDRGHLNNWCSQEGEPFSYCPKQARDRFAAAFREKTLARVEED